jgi:hydrogenase large subunit
VVENFAAGALQAKYTAVKADDISNPGVFNEGVGHSWYEYPDQMKSSLHPWEGVTKAKFTAPKEGTPTDWKALDENGKYSWLKTPKWCGKVCEVGPLARYIIIYTKAKQNMLPDPSWAEKMMVDQVETVSKVLGLAPEVWMPTMVGRTAVRALEAQLDAEISKFFFDKLIANIKQGDTKVANMEKWEPSTWPKQAHGVGLYEAPRGALSHWCVIKDGKIANYQAIVPTTWNACPAG